MKKLLYSTYTKIIVSIVCILCVIHALSAGIDGLKVWDEYKSEIYHFEENFENCDATYLALASAELEMFYAVSDYLNIKKFDIKERLDNLIDSNHIDYYLSLDDKVIVNTIGDINQYSYYSIVNIEDDGKYKKEIFPEDKNYVSYHTKDLVLHKVDMKIALKDTYVNSLLDLWNEQKVLVEETITNVSIPFATSIVLFLYLIIVCGKDSKGNHLQLFLDRMYIEINICITLLLSVLFLEISMLSLNQFMYGDLSYKLIRMILQISALIYSTCVLTLFLSVIRIIKNKMFLSRSLIYKMIRFIVSLFKSIIKELRLCMAHHTTVVVLGVLFIYTAIIGWFGNESYHHGEFILFGIGLFVFVGYFCMRYLNDLNKIKKGVHNIRVGNTNYKIDSLMYKDLNLFKDDINDISKGLSESLSQSLKAERLKTELITNVSHDLKTPLTSIISYTRLLSDMNNLPEEAKDYISIIDKKGQRLKTLTQDLFDIAKVQSGNEEVYLERLNVETLLSQSLAEYEQEFKKFTVCINIEDNLYIYSDGRKMSRVINNLLVNIIKYTMPHTRVFINAMSKENKVVIEMKNISSYPLDFNKDEIMNRFVRADSSRSEEGHGLGLAIVKSYVEVTGGSFDIVLDGDMFKAIIEYDKQ